MRRDGAVSPVLVGDAPRSVEQVGEGQPDLARCARRFRPTFLGARTEEHLGPDGELVLERADLLIALRDARAFCE